MSYYLNLSKEEFYKQLEEFKKLNSVPDITEAQFKQVLKDELDATNAAAERESVGELRGDSTEENNAKCFKCSSGLSIIEAKLYGNRCTFCADTRFEWPLFGYLLSCYYDWCLYYAKIELIRKNPNEASSYFIACLGNMGFVDINQIKEIKDKKQLLRELRNGN